MFAVTVQSHTGSGTIIHLKKFIKTARHRFNLAQSSGKTVPISFPITSPLQSKTVTVSTVTLCSKIYCTNQPTQVSKTKIRKDFNYLFSERVQVFFYFFFEQVSHSNCSFGHTRITANNTFAQCFSFYNRNVNSAGIQSHTVSCLNRLGLSKQLKN